MAGDAPTYVNGQLIVEETVLHHVSELDMWLISPVIWKMTAEFISLLILTAFFCRVIVLLLEVITSSGIVQTSALVIE